MDLDLHETRKVVLRNTTQPRWVDRFRRIDFVFLTVGIASVLMSHGVRESEVYHRPWELPVIIVVSMLWLTLSLSLRYRWSLAKPTFFARHRWRVGVSALWVFSLVLVVIFGPALPEWTSSSVSRWDGMVAVSQIAILLRGATAFLSWLRTAAAGDFNPAFLLVGSFIGLVSVGTLLLMLPRARVRPPVGPAQGAPFVTALFTATSASCVTGLIVEDTPTYWSREGQLVILGLFQIGGLGIMTFGAFFGLIAGRNIGLKEHATLSDLLDSEGLGNVRQLLGAILAFTLAMEIVGAISLSGLWSDQPLGERVFLSLFHSVSSFCNAGFALTENSFVGMAHLWQVGGVLALLIIVGGLGFAVLFDVARFTQHQVQGRRKAVGLLHERPLVRLTLTTKIVLTSTIILLLGGTATFLLLERHSSDGMSESLSIADAWFQSVTFRTAGFNTVDLGQLQPASKLLGILLMYIGASPGSTGGGVKTIAFSIAVLGLLSVVRGRRHIECFGRTLPDILMHRALAVMFLSLMLIMVTTALLVFYEDQPEYFLDYMFEATSAVGTVGVSSTIEADSGAMVSVTQSLSTPSRLLIILAMFLGRVGPLTLLLAIAGQASPARYQYPEERVTLG
ncbi:MAG: hypothetical protein KDA52_02650 [Planctomycetaceae bacterium]|nr:hypothetical protein [Planctomycetaceae bacterium]